MTIVSDLLYLIVLLVSNRLDSSPRFVSGETIYTWRPETTSNLWSDPSNWMGGLIPTDNSTVNITSCIPSIISMSPITGGQTSLRLASFHFCPTTPVLLKIFGGATLIITQRLDLCENGQLAVTASSLVIGGGARIDGILSLLQDAVLQVAAAAALLGRGLVSIDTCRQLCSAATPPHRLAGTSAVPLLLASGTIAVAGSFAQTANMTVQPTNQGAQGVTSLLDLTAGELRFSGRILALSAIELFGAAAAAAAAANGTAGAAPAPGRLVIGPGSGAAVLGYVTLRDVALISAGEVFVAAAAQVTLLGAAAAVNDGVWSIAAGSDLVISGGGGARFVNRGTVAFAAGGGGSAQRLQCPCPLADAAACGGGGGGGAVVNTGAVGLLPGAALILESGCAIVQAGPAARLDVPAGATVTCLLASVALPCIVLRGGTLAGAGAVQGAVRSAGLIRPGPGTGGPGTLSILGPLVQEPGGLLEVVYDPAAAAAAAAAAAGSSGGPVLASGLVAMGSAGTSLAGTVLVRWLSESPPPAGTEIPFLAAAQPVAGTAMVALLTFASGASLPAAALTVRCAAGAAETAGCGLMAVAVVGCPAGWRAATATACLACAAGRYSSARDAVACDPCPPVGAPPCAYSESSPGRAGCCGGRLGRGAPRLFRQPRSKSRRRFPGFRSPSPVAPGPCAPFRL